MLLCGAVRCCLARASSPHRAQREAHHCTSFVVYCEILTCLLRKVLSLAPWVHINSARIRGVAAAVKVVRSCSIILNAQTAFHPLSWRISCPLADGGHAAALQTQQMLSQCWACNEALRPGTKA